MCFKTSNILKCKLYLSRYPAKCKGPSSPSVAITTNALISNPAHGEMHSIRYVMKFISDLWQVGGFPPPIKLTATM